MPEQEVDIILVDDNPADADLVIRALQKHHPAYKLMHLSDGVDLLDLLLGNGSDGRHLKRMPKVIVLDLKMPRIDGFEALEAIRADPSTKRIPVVIFTSSSPAIDVQKAYDLGANSYIEKPIEFDRFTETVEQLGSYWLMTNQESMDYSLRFCSSPTLG